MGLRMSLRGSPIGRIESPGDSQADQGGGVQGSREATEGKERVGEGRNTDLQR